MAGPPVAILRDPQADLIPRFDGSVVAIVPQRLRDEAVVGGLIAGQAVLDLHKDGALAGMSVLEQRRQWPREAIGWELPARATPHRLVLQERRDGGFATLRWDADRRLFGVVWSDAAEPELFALGPRAYAATVDDRLVGLLADLRGFERA